MASIRLVASNPAKINLFLHITGRRPDGYHLLESLFCPINLCDEVDLTLETSSGSGLEIVRIGPLNTLPESTDSTVRACQAMYSAMQATEHWKVTLKVYKQIPEQAGLGGGSSDAARVLKMLNDALGAPLPQTKLHEMGLSLGADTPFFLQSSAAFVEGIGEILTPVRLPEIPLIVYKPPQACPTGEIFSYPGLTRCTSPVKIAVFDSERLRKNPESGLADWLRWINLNTQNDLQAAVEVLKPDWCLSFRQFCESVQSGKPPLVRMTGSGSAIFAAFPCFESRDRSFEQLVGLPGLLFKCETLSNESDEF